MITTRVARVVLVLLTVMTRPARHLLVLRCVVFFFQIFFHLSSAIKLAAFHVSRIHIPHMTLTSHILFQRNAIRLNGTNTSDTTSSYRLSPTTPPSPLTSPHKSAANRVFTVGAVSAIPLLIATLFL